MKTNLVSFKTKDGLELPGLLYTPDRKNKKVLIDLHGNGTSSSFYHVEQNREVSKVLVKKGIAYFPFNNRGAHLIKSFSFYKNKRKQRISYGSAYELIKECVIDIDSAIAFLEKEGFREFYLMGHSTGANKICVYNYYKPRNKIKKYILSAGGDDTGIYYKLLGRRRFMALLKKSKTLAKSKRKTELATDVFYAAMSWQSIYDTINPDGDYNIFPYNEYFDDLGLSRKKLFREFDSIRKPTLVVYGDKDEYLPRPVEEIVDVLKGHTHDKESLDFVTIKGADHSYAGKEREFASKVGKWLTS